MGYNTCNVCGASDGRAGMLIASPSRGWVHACENCHDTRESGSLVIHTKLIRNKEEIEKTKNLLK